MDSYENAEPVGRNTKRIRGIALDLMKYDFSESIKNKACEIFFRLSVGNPRKKQRVKTICYCVYQAMIELKLGSIDPKTLELTFGLTKQEINSAIALNPTYKAGYKQNNSTTNPSDLLKMYASESFRFSDDTVDDMVKSFQDVISKSEALLTKQARTLIAAFMWYYMECNGFTSNSDEFAKVFSLQFTTIKLHYKDIVEAVIED
ncbi:Transcription initiation factor TFIIB [uncultured virus]|nr:Transcription initiation factor TFIIB [uncultured virus]